MLIRIAKSATSADLPDFYKRWWVWPATAVSAFLGGLLVNAIDLDQATQLTGFSQKLVVLLVGYGAPNIIANLAGIVGDKISNPPAPPAPGPASFTRYLRT